jgi:HD-GYP domain-containing protein (c-di-GMP phosphodiesterase class II)
LETVKLWASLHHERLDGTGYPFGLTAKNLPLGAQIVAVADIYTALDEVRPYRPALNKVESIAIMKKMVHSQAINGNLVNLLEQNFAEIDWQRKKAQETSSREYKDINTLYRALS